MAPYSKGPSESFTGDWVCSKCGKTGFTLPFKPTDPSRPVKCGDCHKAERQQFSGGGGQRSY